jgi:hypothetical protein
MRWPRANVGEDVIVLASLPDTETKGKFPDGWKA